MTATRAPLYVLYSSAHFIPEAQCSPEAARRNLLSHMREHHVQIAFAESAELERVRSGDKASTQLAASMKEKRFADIAEQWKGRSTRSR